MAGKKKRGISPEEEARRRLLRDSLEFVLPAQQVPEAVQMLWDRFGSFEGVFLAPEEALAAVLGPEGARYLQLTMELARACLEDKSRDVKRVYDTDSAVELFRPKFLGRKT